MAVCPPAPNCLYPPKGDSAGLESLAPLVAAVDPVADAPALAPTAGAQEIQPVIPRLALSEVEGPALTVSVLTPRGRIASGENVTLTVLVEAPALVRNATISLTLPDGLEAVLPRAAAGVIAVNDLDIDRRRRVQVVARVNSVVVPMSLRLRVGASAPGLAPADIRAVGGKLAIYGDQVAQRVLAAGGRAAFGERIVMSFAANALSRDAEIEISSGPTNAEPEDEFDPILAFEASPGQAFRAPVTLTLALSGLLGGRVGYGAEPVLRHWRVSEDGQSRAAERIPASFDPSTAELIARLEHFSQYDVVLQTPQDPKPWQMVSNLGGVNAFRGTSAIAIPIDVPPMQDGLEPKLALQYSSGGAERQSDSPGGAGMG